MKQATNSEVAEFIIGTDVQCNDGDVGELKRVVINPIARTITHLVVEPRHRRGAGHLVPIELVSYAVEHEIRLRCTEADFNALDEAEEIHFVPGANGGWNYQESQMFTLPYYPLGGMGLGMSGTGMGIGPHAVITDRIPAGDVEVRRGDHVHATDGAIGRVQGLVVDPGDQAVTHVLLDEGHLWGKKRVAIPIGVVTHADDGVQVRLSKHEIEALPAVTIDDPK